MVYFHIITNMKNTKHCSLRKLSIKSKEKIENIDIFNTGIKL